MSNTAKRTALQNIINSLLKEATVSELIFELIVTKPDSIEVMIEELETWYKIVHEDDIESEYVKELTSRGYSVSKP